MDNIIVTLVILTIVALAGYYIYSKKKKGVKCIGCPDSDQCSGVCGSCSGCCNGCPVPKDPSHL